MFNGNVSNCIYFRTLQSKFGDSSREFSRSESKVHYLVLLNPKNRDMFILITINHEKFLSVRSWQLTASDHSPNDMNNNVER